MRTDSGENLAHPPCYGSELFSGDEDGLKRRCTQLALSVRNRGATVTLKEVVGRATAKCGTVRLRLPDDGSVSFCAKRGFDCATARAVIPLSGAEDLGVREYPEVTPDCGAAVTGRGVT